MNIDLSLFSSPILGTTEFLNKLPLKAGQLLVDIETKQVWYDKVSNNNTVTRELFLPTATDLKHAAPANQIPTAAAITQYVTEISGGLVDSAISDGDIIRTVFPEG